MGGVLGGFLNIQTKGLDFALTALFLVLFTDRWVSVKADRPSCLTGAAASICCLLLFGADYFMIAALAVMLLLFLFFKDAFEREGGGRI